jgi:uncharacterized membrane protein YqiK
VSPATESTRAAAAKKLGDERIIFIMSGWPDWINAGCAVINVVVVVTLARFNFLYLKAAERQAKAAESAAAAANNAAESAELQAAAAAETLRVLQESQRSTRKDEEQELLTSLKETLDHFRYLQSAFRVRQAGLTIQAIAPWRRAAQLLNLRRPDLIEEVSDVGESFSRLAILYPAYDEAAKHQHGANQQPLLLVLESADKAIKALETIINAL